VSRRFAETTAEPRHRSQLAKESYLADRHRLATDRTIALRRSEGEGEREVERWLVQDDAANQICVDVAVADRNASTATEHGGEEGEARRIESASGATRCAEGGASNERLHLNQHRATPFKKWGDHRPWCARLAIVNEGASRIVNASEPVLPHLKEAELVCGAEAILCGAQCAQCAVAIAVQHHHRIHKVLQRLRSRNAPLLGDVANEDHRAVRCTSGASEPVGGATHLTNAARRTLKSAERCGLNRVNDQEGWPCEHQRLADRANFALRKELNTLRRRALHQAESFSTIRDLRRRLFARCIKDATTRHSDPRRRLKKQRALSNARLSAEQDDRPRDGTATEDAVKLRDAEWKAWRAVGAGELQRLRSRRARG
jgi:hypothetical protein